MSVEDQHIRICEIAIRVSGPHGIKSTVKWPVARGFGRLPDTRSLSRMLLRALGKLAVAAKGVEIAVHHQEGVAVTFLPYDGITPDKLYEGMMQLIEGCQRDEAA